MAERSYEVISTCNRCGPSSVQLTTEAEWDAYLAKIEITGENCKCGGRIRRTITE